MAGLEIHQRLGTSPENIEATLRDALVAQGVAWCVTVTIQKLNPKLTNTQEICLAIAQCTELSRRSSG